MKRMYEFMVLATKNADLTSEKKQKAFVEALLKGQKDSSVKDVKLYGKKPLAYPIKKQAEGQYILAHIESKGLHVGTIQNVQKTTDDILRFLVVLKQSEQKQGKKPTKKKKEDK